MTIGHPPGELCLFALGQGGAALGDRLLVHLGKETVRATGEERMGLCGSIVIFIWDNNMN